MNNLQYETSPYLLQHANNPVDWYAWKPEAFEKAREEDKPILVSIGYSTCHWCHVMERESFENEEVANFMNKHFINIKVDREERPDIDQIYMEACQAINGSGGWPLNCFLLPDGQAFFAGTYYPPRQVHNRPSWRQLLEYLHDAFKNRRTEVEQQAKQLMDTIAGSDRLFIQALQPESGEKKTFTEEQTAEVFKALERNFDRRYGGIGGAPKFPATMALTFLLEYAHIAGKERAKDHVVFSLEQMINGGIYDQLGGGFARYATDGAWLVPHFEKMLYDNALLVGLLADAYQHTSIPLYKETIEETIGFLLRELYKADEGFYAALDADSEGEEGKYYVWSKAEIDQLLGSKSAAFCDYYGVTKAGNWEGVNILHRRMPLSNWAEKYGLTVEEAKANLQSCRASLFAARSKRVRPGLDDKILLNWNAMMVKALVKASVALDEKAYLDTAVRTMQFLLSALRVGAEEIALYHTYKDNRGQYRAFLDDYALLIEAMITLYQADYDLEWLRQAEQYTDFVIRNFLGRDDKMFYFTSNQQEDIPLRKKDAYDSAVPSGNSTMVNNLLELGILLGRADFNKLAEDMLEQMAGAIVKYPSSFANWARALLHKTHPYYEIAIVGPEAMLMAVQMNQHYIPNSIRMVSKTAQADFPLLAGKSEAGDTKIYVCQEYACRAPVQSVEHAISQMN